MNIHLKKAVQMVNAARPTSGFRPDTPEEWAAVQDAAHQFGYALMRESGLSHVQATDFAQKVYGGAAGRLLLDIALSEVGDVNSGK